VYLAHHDTVTGRFVKNFFGVKDIKEGRQRLDRLVQAEVATNTAQILEIVYDQSENMKQLMDGEPT